MSLPILEAPTYFLTIPSTGKEIKYRPFLVKEDKVLAIALQEEDNDKIIFESIKNIISSCTFGQVDIEKLTLFDIEWIFLQLVIKSRGAFVSLIFTCNNIVEDGEVCGQENVIQVNLDEVKLSATPNKKIMLTDSIGVNMRFPTFSEIQEYLLSEKNGDVHAILPTYIECVFEGDKIITDFSQEDLVEFIDSMTDEQFNKISDFFRNLPTLTWSKEIQCTKCGHKETVTVVGLQNFLV